MLHLIVHPAEPEHGEALGESSALKDKFDAIKLSSDKGYREAKLLVTPKCFHLPPGVGFLVRGWKRTKRASKQGREAHLAPGMNKTKVNGKELFGIEKPRRRRGGTGKHSGGETTQVLPVIYFKSDRPPIIGHADDHYYCPRFLKRNLH